MGLRSHILRFSLLLILIKSVICDEYVDEIRDKCFQSKILVYCGQYRLVKYLMGFCQDGEELREIQANSTEEVRVVKLKNGGLDLTNFPRMRQISEDTEFTKLIKFVTRKTLTYLNNNGLVINLPDGTNIVDEKDGTIELDKAREDTSRTKRKKKLLIIPILLLFKMFKVKVLLGFVLAGIVFIKKVILAVALLLPAMFQSLKSHCKSDDEKYHYRADDRFYSYPHEPSFFDDDHYRYGYQENW